MPNDAYTIAESNLIYLRNVIHNGVRDARAAGIDRLALVPVAQWIPFRLAPDPAGLYVLDGHNGHAEDAVLDALVEGGVVRVVEG